MTQRKAVVEHVAVVRHHEDQPASTRTIVIFDDDGRRIGHSPSHNVEQLDYKKHRGVITTTLKITRAKGK